MKTCIRVLVFIFLILFFHSFAILELSAETTAQTPKALLTNADPFILYYDGVYYSYGTNHNDGIRCYVSNDLHSWKLLDNNHDGLVLNKVDVWGDKWFWAPEVYALKDRFLIYFTAAYHISCAESASPAGPFVQKVKRPISPGERRIDNHLFIDDDGKAYCFFSRCKDPGGPGGSVIWAMEMESDLMTAKEDTLFRCFGRTEPWESIQNAVMEGPFMIKHKGKYYLTYSANDYKSHDYAIGYAVADHIKGPYVKIEKAPILHRPDGMVGAGHHSFFTDKAGKLRIVFHVHCNKQKIHPRHAVIGDVFFEEGKLRIGKKFIIPTVEK